MPQALQRFLTFNKIYIMEKLIKYYDIDLYERLKICSLEIPSAY